MNIKDIQNYTVVDQPKIEERNVGEKVVDFLGGEALRKRLTGAATQLTSEYQSLTKANQEKQAIIQKINTQILKNQAIGKDTTQLKSTLTELQRDDAAEKQKIRELGFGGVSDRAALGSTVSFGSSMIPGAVSTAPKLVSTAAKAGKQAFAGQFVNATKGFVRSPIVKEGAILGGTFAGGDYIASAEDPSAGGLAGAVAGGATLGGVTSGVAEKALRGLGTKAGTLSARYISPQERRLAADATYDFTVAMQPGGSKTAGALTKQYFGGENSKTFKGLQGLYENSQGVEFTNLAGQKKVFTPDNVELVDLPPLIIESKNSIYNKALARLEEVSGTSAKVNLNPVIDVLEKKAATTQNKNTQRMIRDRIEEITGLDDPILIQKYITDEINPKTGSYVTSGSNAVEGRLYAELNNKLTQTLDDYLATNNAPVRELFEQYEGIKSFEKDITRRVSAELRKQGNQQAAEFVDDYGLAVLLSGVSYGNVMQATKGFALVVLNTLGKLAKDPNKRISNTFKSLEKYYKIKGVDSVVPPSNPVQRNIRETRERINTPALPAKSSATFPEGVAPGVKNADAIPLPSRTASSADAADTARATAAFNETRSLDESVQSFASEIKGDVPKEVVKEALSGLRLRSNELEIQADVLKDFIEGSPFYKNKNNKFMVDKEGTVRDPKDTKNKLSRRLNDLQEEGFGAGNDVDLAGEYIKYQNNKKRLVDLESQLKKTKLEIEKIINDPEIDESIKNDFNKMYSIVGAALLTASSIEASKENKSLIEKAMEQSGEDTFEINLNIS